MYRSIQKLLRPPAALLLFASLVAPLAVVLPPPIASADPSTNPVTGQKTTCIDSIGQVVTCPEGDAAANGSCKDVSHCDIISKYVNPFVNFLAVLFTLILVISIVVGGIQYGSSGGDPQKAAAARGRITNAVVALIAFVLLYAGLNFLIPGGLL